MHPYSSSLRKIIASSTSLPKLKVVTETEPMKGSLKTKPSETLLSKKILTIDANTNSRKQSIIALRLKKASFQGKLASLIDAIQAKQSIKQPGITEHNEASGQPKYNEQEIHRARRRIKTQSGQQEPIGGQERILDMVRQFRKGVFQ